MKHKYRIVKDPFKDLYQVQSKPNGLLGYFSQWSTEVIANNHPYCVEIMNKFIRRDNGEFQPEIIAVYHP